MYGNAEFMGIPWEVLIKSYREELGNETFAKISDYLTSFVNYIQKVDIYNKNDSEDFIKNYCYHLIKQLINLEKYNRGNLKKTINDFSLSLEKRQILYPMNTQHFIDEYADLIKSMFNNYFSGQHDLKNSFLNLLMKYIQSSVSSRSKTGIVLAGYGNKEMFPFIINFSINGMIDGKVRYHVNNITSADPVKGNVRASLNPFAQHEMVSTVLDGIDPSLNKFREQQLNSIKNELIAYFGKGNKLKLENLFEQNDVAFKKQIKDEFNSPIVNMLSSLSIDELGNMAETLVSLTSFKRKYSGAMRTVGGPVDVLVISKGEGPVWLKRRKYFNKEMNEGYYLRRK